MVRLRILTVFLRQDFFDHQSVQHEGQEKSKRRSRPAEIAGRRYDVFRNVAFICIRSASLVSTV